jgi:hypothetical protein
MPVTLHGAVHLYETPKIPVASDWHWEVSPLEQGSRATFSRKPVGRLLDTTREQFITTFGTASKRVVFVRDVD